MVNNSNSPKRSICPVACTLDILGDKWSLLVVRDLLLGKRRYKEFQNSHEKIPTNILADRLKRLEEYELVKKEAYQDNPPRYQYIPSRKCVDLIPVIKEISKWGMKHINGTFQIPENLLKG